MGREHVFFLVFEENRFILDAMGMLPAENIISIRTGGLMQVIGEALRALREVRRRGIDTVIDMEFFARSSAVLAYLSGARWRVGLHRFQDPAPYRGNLATHPLRFRPGLHTARLFDLMVAALDQQPAELQTFEPLDDLDAGSLPGFRAAPEELTALRGKLTEHGGWEPGRPLVLLNANCSDLLPLRRWPEERYVTVARQLLAEFPDLHISFTGAPDESAGAGRLAAAIASPRCFSLAGKTSMRELLVLYAIADLLITNDSGPAHFASLTGIDTIVIFGPETPKLFAAEGPRTHVLWAALPCSPCVSAFNNRVSQCRDNLCMKSITVDQVLGLAREIITGRHTTA